MKKILLAAMAATMFAACTQNEEVENLNSNKEMKFNTAVMATTKAGAITTATFEKFKLYANYNQETFIDGVIFTKSANVWGTTPVTKFYWPGTNDVTFWGCSVETMNDLKNSTATSFGYTVDEVADNQEDVLVSEKTKLNATSNGGTASIAFTHALTKMAFQVKGKNSEIEYTVNSISISANSTATYTYGTGWGDTSVPKTYSVLSTAVADIIGDAADATIVGSSMMMLPQNNATITIGYSYLIPNITTAIAAEDKTFTLNWEKGKNLLYTITLDGPSVLNVEGTVTDGDWSNSGTDTPIPAAK